ncbi:MAG TPA: hypothetical protein VFH61_17815 [Thermoleophilia bacterium]|nr:hypothetical protein [Thermoleophilia bacterium]
MAIEVQFRVHPGHDDDGVVRRILNEGVIIPFQEWRQWGLNNTIPPSADLSLLTQAQIARERRTKAEYLYWLDPQLDPQEVADNSEYSVEQVAAHVAQYQADYDAWQALGFYSTHYGHQELKSSGVAVVDAEPRHVLEWLEPKVDESAHPAQPSGIVLGRNAFRLNYQAFDVANATLQALYQSLISTSVWTPPFGHPLQGRPWTPAEVIAEIEFL